MRQEDMVIEGNYSEGKQDGPMKMKKNIAG